MSRQFLFLVVIYVGMQAFCSLWEHTEHVSHEYSSDLTWCLLGSPEHDQLTYLPRYLEPTLLCDSLLLPTLKIISPPTETHCLLSRWTSVVIFS
ncbi:uncharacterized protein F4807DRAFT_404343, partial [Annulohypoxylon truncatum]|uniref:uncharacterized protein n=1 Tax=Annulohypoxylon truncatum TaxID=327061 RepID=UPI002008E123